MKVKAILDYITYSRRNIYTGEEFYYTEFDGMDYHIKLEIDLPDGYGNICNTKYIDKYPAYLFQVITEKPLAKCECGADKIGYTKPGKAHGVWCDFYKEA